MRLLCLKNISDASYSVSKLRRNTTSHGVSIRTFNPISSEDIKIK